MTFREEAQEWNTEQFFSLEKEASLCSTVLQSGKASWLYFTYEEVVLLANDASLREVLSRGSSSCYSEK